MIKAFLHIFTVSYSLDVKLFIYILAKWHQEILRLGLLNIAKAAEVDYLPGEICVVINEALEQMPLGATFLGEVNLYIQTNVFIFKDTVEHLSDCFLKSIS